MGNQTSAARQKASKTLSDNLMFKDRHRVEENYNIAEKDLGRGTKSMGSRILRADPKRFTKTSRSQQGYAIKVFEGKADIPPDLKEEARLLQMCDHPNIVKLYQVNKVYEPANPLLPSVPKITPRRISLVLELCSGGDLSSRLPYTEKETRRIIRQVLRAVAHLHHHHIVHRDIEMSNILYKSNDETEIKLIDFGSAMQQEKNPDKPSEYLPLTEKTGSVRSMAPEVIKGNYGAGIEYGPKADVWSVGVLMYGLLKNGEHIYVGKTIEEIENKITSGLYSPNFSGWPFSKDAKEFIQACLTRHPDKRPSAAEALQHKWMLKSDTSKSKPANPLGGEPSFSKSTSDDSSTDTKEADNNNKATEENKSTSPLKSMKMSSSTVAAATPISPSSPNFTIPTDLLVSLELYGRAPPLKRVALNVLAKNSFAFPPEYTEFFYHLDHTGSGTINRDDFVRGMVQHQSGFSKEELDELFVQLDVNGKNEIAYTEFMAATLESGGEELDEDRIREAFDLLDEDRSGHISKKNLLKLLGGKKHAEDVVMSIIGDHQQHQQQQNYPARGSSPNTVRSSLVGSISGGGDPGIGYDEFAALLEHTFSSRSIDPIIEASLDEDQLEYIRMHNQIDTKNEKQRLGVIGE